jgi:hypothetical protein
VQGAHGACGMSAQVLGHPSSTASTDELHFQSWSLDIAHSNGWRRRTTSTPDSASLHVTASSQPVKLMPPFTLAHSLPEFCRYGNPTRGHPLRTPQQINTRPKHNKTVAAGSHRLSGMHARTCKLCTENMLHSLPQFCMCFTSSRRNASTADLAELATLPAPA